MQSSLDCPLLNKEGPGINTMILGRGDVLIGHMSVHVHDWNEMFGTT